MRQAIRNKDTANMEEELGDIFFVLVNLGRHLGIDCEEASRNANIKFERRFKGMEADIKLKNEDMKSFTLAQWNAYWDHQKTLEKKSA